MDALKFNYLRRADSTHYAFLSGRARLPGLWTNQTAQPVSYLKN